MQRIRYHVASIFAAGLFNGCRMSALGLGRVKTVSREFGSESQRRRASHAPIAAISGLVPRMSHPAQPQTFFNTIDHKQTFRHILTKRPEATILSSELAEWNSAE
jgi:hypothetical protein